MYHDSTGWFLNLQGIRANEILGHVVGGMVEVSPGGCGSLGEPSHTGEA
jgi:hypothetical protein